LLIAFLVSASASALSLNGFLRASPRTPPSNENVRDKGAGLLLLLLLFLSPNSDGSFGVAGFDVPDTR
jgi:hypothetical protein